MSEQEDGPSKIQKLDIMSTQDEKELSHPTISDNVQWDNPDENKSTHDLDVETAEVYLHEIELTGTESVSGYTEGGYHPVYLGDKFQDGRYRVLHKLGNGGFSTVWLARDCRTDLLVALKVMVAVASSDKEPNEVRIWKHLKQKETTDSALKYFCMLSDHFLIIGPNGRHACLVYPVTGPNLGTLFDANVRLRGSVAREVSRQLTQALASLHSRGICHGDLTSSNLTLKLSDFESWTDAEVKERLGEPKVELLKITSGKPLPNCFPRYIVQPVDMYRLDPKLQTQELSLIDFNESFFIDEPPKDIGIPPPYRSPSLWFGESPSTTSDLWALGCTIFCLRVGRDLIFDAFVSMGAFHSVETIIGYLGPLPDRWDKLYFDEYGTAKFRSEITSKIRRHFRKQGEEERLQPWSREPPEYTLSELAMLVCDDYHGPTRQEDIENAGLNPTWKPRHAKVKFPADEARAFGDILELLLCYDLKEGTSAESLFEHSWLTDVFPDSTPAEDAAPLFQSNWAPYEPTRRT